MQLESSSLNIVRGCGLMIDSLTKDHTEHVIKEGRGGPRVALRTHITILSMHSQTPPICGVEGGMNDQESPLKNRSSMYEESITQFPFTCNKVLSIVGVDRLWHSMTCHKELEGISKGV